MRQLDLFASFFEPPQEKDQPEKEKIVSDKKSENAAVAEPLPSFYSKNTLRAQPAGSSNGSEEKGEVPIPDRIVAPPSPAVTTPAPLPTLFDTAVSDVIREKAGPLIARPETETSIAIVEDVVQPEMNKPVSAPPMTVNLPVTVAEEATIEPSALQVEVVEPIQKPVTASKRLKQKAPELESSGSVIFDDGKISVKIKTKNPFPPPIVKAKKEKEKKIPQKRGRKSFKDIDAEVDLIEIPEDETLFQKQYYPISEVAKWFRVNTSLLRFWENEFDVLKPRKNRKGDRLFRPEDVKNLQLIYQLLRQRKYTIEGAKEYIKTNKKKADIQSHLTNTLQKFKSFLLDMKATLQ